jgi:spermidine/putrescine transport system permease protein
LVIGAAVVVLSVLLGLAGSLLLTQIWPRARAAYYTIITAPILMPGVVIGISTVLFWDRVATGAGAGYGSALYDGLFLTTMGQSCFIASYCMLVFVARLQRFDYQLIDAALDLGATNAQAFRKILLPFLRPAIASAAIIAFLASFENYNTSVFTLSHYTSFTVEVAQKVRLGIDPSISALAVIVISLTLFAAIAREAQARRAAQRLGGRPPFGGVAGALLGNPPAIVAAFLLVATAAAVAFAARHDPAACKADALQQRLERQRQFEEQGRRRPAPPAAVPERAPAAPPPARGQNPGQGSFGDIFTPGNLQRGSPPAEPPAPAPAPPSAAPNPGRGSFGDIFTPGNLQRTPTPPGGD